MKFSILGDDGKNYDFISKFGEGGYNRIKYEFKKFKFKFQNFSIIDIRQDERVQQIFSICSQMFDNVS